MKTFILLLLCFNLCAQEDFGYKTLAYVSGSHIAGSVAGTYAMASGNPLAISGTGTLYPLHIIYLNANDYETNGFSARLRLRAALFTNDVAPTGNYTIGLYPITRPSNSGGAGLNVYTLGTVVSGSQVSTFTTPPEDASNLASGNDFQIPSTGLYVIGVVTTSTVAASSLVHINAQLQIHYQ